MNKTIWMCWFQGKNSKMPWLNKSCIKRWKEINPDWKFHLLSSDNISEYCEDFNAIIKKERSLAANSDLLRLLLLSKHGGVWVDASVLPINPLSSFYKKIINKTDFFSYRFKPRTLDKETVSWFLCAKNPNNYLINRWRDKFIEIYTESKYWQKYSIHKCLSLLYDEDPDIRYIINSMTQIDQKIPHSAERNWNKRTKSYMYKRPRWAEPMGLD